VSAWLWRADELAPAVAIIEDRMSELSQANYPASLKTPLGDNVLVLRSFSGDEVLGQPFEFHVDALSEQENIDFDKALGQACTIKLKSYEQKERFFCGILTHARWVGSEIGGKQGYFRYRLVLRPWFWLLAHRADCRIFLKKKVTDIIEKVFKDAGFSSGTDFKFSTQEKYQEIEYCVQYRETDFAFVSRLMEQYGIYYYFEHQDGEHKMILADCKGSHSKIKDLPTVKYNVQTEGYARAEQHVHSWISERRFCTGKFRFDDYNYLTPKVLKASKDASEKYQRSKFEVFDYPGKYDEQDNGDLFAKVRLEAEQALDHRRSASGDAPSIFAGGLIEVEKYPASDKSPDHLVIRASHQYGTQFYGPSQGADGPAYHGNYEFLPSDRPFRSLPLTAKPRIHGIQTAKVVAEKKEDQEEISTDKYGRIWVQFYWDREPQNSCAIRVSQPWAGKRWGQQFIPRVGMEVVVEFLEGDPDRPLVTGCVYNGENEHPYRPLPDSKTQSGVKSDSSRGHNGYNEFMFEDSKDGELIRMHAQKDHDVTVRNSETWTIGEACTGGASRTTTLENGNDSLTIKKGDQSVDISLGGQSTQARSSIETVSHTQVTHAVISESLTSQTLDAGGVTLIAPEVVKINAPMVLITGNLFVAGGIFMGPMCTPVT
jgi:type VI secretion system secreted protein VgrG